MEFLAGCGIANVTLLIFIYNLRSDPD